MNKRYWHIICFLLLSVSVFAQKAPKVSASLSRDTIRIGEQATLTLEVQAKPGEKIEFPRLADTLTNSVEVVEASQVDTLAGKESITYTQRYTITSFDSGAYSIPDFQILAGNEGERDTLTTGSLAFYTQDVAVDTSKAVKDIKDVVSLPPPPTDYSWMWWLLLLIPLGVAIYFLLKYLKNRPVKEKPEPVKPKIPAHILALDALKKLEEAKLWQKGNYKEYHSQLSQILRRYIEDRFKMHAMEQTSGQILSMMKQSKVTSSENLEQLAQVLHLSDMVKFAKTVPIGEENEMSRDNAKSFINNTTLVEQEEETKE